jgi:quinol monooxygenase YgiN
MNGVTMSEVVVVAIISAAAGKGAQAEALVTGTLVPPTHAEDGCITFALHRDLADPDRLVLVERWSGREALDRHLAADHLAAFRAAVAPLSAAPAQVVVMEAIPAGDPAKGALAIA